MHSAGYEALSLPFAYVPFGVQETDLPGALQGMRALGIRGLGVSMPFKLAVLPLLDRGDPLAARIGAVNTIVNDDGALTGYNTDATGAVRALGEKLELPGKRVVLLGAGGAARAVAFGLHAQGARLHIANRSPAKAETLARSVGADVTASGLEPFPPTADADAVVNCSSATMHGGGSELLPAAALGPGRVVMDIVYAPIRTRLVEAAERAGAVTIHGGRMLLHQACGQFALYTGVPAPLEAMRAALEVEMARQAQASGGG
jgi:shikimate dehydrogenase